MTTRETPYSFCRYQLKVYGRLLSPNEQLTTLTELRGRLFPHRKAQPSPDDHDTMVMMPVMREIEGTPMLRWCVGQQISVRVKSRYGRDEDRIIPELEQADEVIFTKFIGLPLLGVVAIMDLAGGRWLSAQNKMLHKYLFVTEFIQLWQAVALVVSGVALATVLFDVLPLIIDRMILAATIASTMYAFRWALGAVRIMHDIVWYRSIYDAYTHRNQASGQVLPMPGGRG